MRVLGVDLGRARTGLALSDPLGITCRPLAVMVERDAVRIAEYIAVMAKEHEVKRIVLGLPRPLHGGANQQMEEVLAFKALLEKHTDVPIVLWDERFTTKLAEKGQRPETPRDAVAACYLLQNYLDAQACDRERSR